MQEVIQNIDDIISQKSKKIDERYFVVDDLLYTKYFPEQWFELVKINDDKNILETFYCRITGLESCFGDQIDGLHLALNSKNTIYPNSILSNRKSWYFKLLTPEEEKNLDLKV